MAKTEQEKLAEKILEIQKAIYSKASNDYGTFFRAAWPVLEPKTPLKRNWHQDLVAEYLTACHNRQIKRLIINLQPRMAKSNLVTVSFAPWVWQKRPEERFIFTSYADGLSSKHSVDRRTIIESDWYRKGFGDKFKMATDQNVKTEFMNDKRGVMIATSMHGTVTGKGCDVLIVDDPHDAQKAYSDAHRESDVAAFNQKFSTRLDDKENGVIIVVMQRLHDQDLTGVLLEQGGWEHLKLEGVAEKTKTYSFPISGKSLVREQGSILHEAREGQDAIAEHKKILGPNGFAAQIQQEPTPLGGRIVDVRKFKKYLSVPPKFQQMIQSWDMTFKDTSKSDFVCGQVWGRIGPDFYLLPGWVRDRLDFVKTIAAVKNLTLKYSGAHRKIIEDTANGPAVISMLRSQIPGIVPYKPKDSKEARLHAVLPFIEAGNVHIPDRSLDPRIDEFLIEVSRFPNGAQDDQVDAMTQALIQFADSTRHDLTKMLQM